MLNFFKKSKKTKDENKKSDEMENIPGVENMGMMQNIEGIWPVGCCDNFILGKLKKLSHTVPEKGIILDHEYQSCACFCGHL